MSYSTTEKKLAYGRQYRKANPEKSRAWSAKWVRSNREKKNELNRKARGEVGSPKRDAYNERRRVRRKRAALAALEASRKHRESLWNFLRSKAA